MPFVQFPLFESLYYLNNKIFLNWIELNLRAMSICQISLKIQAINFIRNLKKNDPINQINMLLFSKIKCCLLQPTGHRKIIIHWNNEMVNKIIHMMPIFQNIIVFYKSVFLPLINPEKCLTNDLYPTCYSYFINKMLSNQCAKYCLHLRTWLCAHC